MRIENSNNTLGEKILILQEMSRSKSISIREILSVLSGKGRFVIVILLCLPFCQPIQLPGLSFPFGLGIMFMGLRFAFGKYTWLPKKFLSKKISTRTLNKVTQRVLTILNKIKNWVHPRLTWICKSPIMIISNGLVIATLGLILALPLPIPLTNLTAAWGILLIAFGCLEDDGFLVLVGYIISMIIVIFLLFTILTAKQNLNNLWILKIN